MPTVDHKLSLNPEQLAKVESAKGWAKRNWKPFVTGAAVAGVTIFVFRGRSGPTQIINNVMPNIAPTFNNDNSSLVNLGGHATKMVKRISDGQLWETVTQAAEENGAPLSLMSRHLNGHKPDVYGEVFKIIGVGTTG